MRKNSSTKCNPSFLCSLFFKKPTVFMPMIYFSELVFYLFNNAGTELSTFSNCPYITV